MSDNKKLLQEHKLMISPSSVKSDVDLLNRYDDALLTKLMEDLASDVSNSKREKKKIASKIEEKLTMLSHMENMMQFMILRDQIRDFKHQRMTQIKRKIDYTNNLKKEIDIIIEKQTGLMNQKAKLRERISRHFLFTGLLWFPAMPVLLGLSLVLGNSFAPVFMVGILALGFSVVMGEKIVHDYQRKTLLADEIDLVCRERSQAIRVYMQYRAEIKRLITNQSYFIEKYAHQIGKKKSLSH